MNDSYHHGNLRDALLEAGLEMLTRDGVQRFSMRKLASELGVSHTAPYRHFNDKQELIGSILVKNSRAFQKALKEAVESDLPGEEKLIRLGAGYVHFFLENPEFLKFFTIMSDQVHILESFLPGNEPAAEEKRELDIHCKSSGYDSLPDTSSYGIFRSVAGEVTANFPHLSEREVLLGYWGKVHGLASLLISQENFIPREEREAVIERILRTPF